MLNVLSSAPADTSSEQLVPWLQEEKDVILKWRDEHTYSDGNVTISFV